MSDPYRKVMAGRLTFKGGDLATVKSIDKKKKKKHKSKKFTDDAVDLDGEGGEPQESSSAAAAEVENIYTIDAAKKLKYEELFPVETKKFGYDPSNNPRIGAKSVEEALDDRVKKKADRYCK